MDSPTSQQQLLAGCRQAFGSPPRRFSLIDRLTYLHTTRPIWCTPADQLSRFFEGRNALLRDGAVVWGHIVQANRLMFRPGPQNCPGDVVYSNNPTVDIDLADLSDIAHRLFDLKGTSQSDPGKKQIADYLANERIRVFGLAVPLDVSDNQPCALSTIFFDRKHLPGGRLVFPFFPIVVNTSRLAMPLPARYWPPQLLSMWEARDSRK